MSPSYPQFFKAATGNKPYLWQCRLACGEPVEPACGEPPEGANCDLENPDETTKQWLSGLHPDGCRSRLIDIPTGLGKTAGVVLAWLWNYLQIQNSNSKIQNTGWTRRPGTVCPRLPGDPPPRRRRSRLKTNIGRQESTRS